MKKEFIHPFVLIQVFVVIGTMVMTSVYADDNPWKSAYKKNGIEVFTRPDTGSDLDEFLGIMEIASSMDMIERIFDDVEGWSKWMANCQESRFIKRIDDETKLVYIVTRAPWPVSFRDSVCTSRKTKDPVTGNLGYEFHAVEDSTIPVGKGYVRVKALHGKWTVIRLSPDRIRVLYTMKCNPGGSIPKYLANMSSRQTPYETLVRLKDSTVFK